MDYELAAAIRDLHIANGRPFVNTLRGETVDPIEVVREATQAIESAKWREKREREEQLAEVEAEEPGEDEDRGRLHASGETVPSADPGRKRRYW